VTAGGEQRLVEGGEERRELDPPLAGRALGSGSLFDLSAGLPDRPPHRDLTVDLVVLGRF
jgi:hypothetical protein